MGEKESVKENELTKLDNLGGYGISCCAKYSLIIGIDEILRL
jgi:hypothetical protein